MNIHRLNLFCTVVKCGGFSKAARRLHLSQQAVSSQVAQLESRLGFPLFVRQGRHVQLTPEGREMYQRAVRLLEQAEALEAWVAQVRQRQKQIVSVLCSTTPGAYVVPSVLSQLQERFPKVDVHLRLLKTPEIPAALEDIELLDFVVFINPIETPHLKAHPVAKDSIWLVAHRDHPLAPQDGQTTLHELAQHPIVLRRSQCDLRQHLLDVYARHGIEPKVTYVESLEACRVAVTHGYGITYLSSYTVHELVTTRVLRRLDVPELRHHRPVYLGMRPGYTLSEPAALMLELVRNRLRELDLQAAAMEAGKPY